MDMALNLNFGSHRLMVHVTHSGGGEIAAPSAPIAADDELPDALFDGARAAGAFGTTAEEDEAAPPSDFASVAGLRVIFFAAGVFLESSKPQIALGLAFGGFFVVCLRVFGGWQTRHSKIML